MNTYSLLWTTAEPNFSTLPAQTIQNLDIDFFVQHISKNDKEQLILKDLMIKLPQNTEDIFYRNEIFQEIMENQSLCQAFADLIDDLSTLQEYSIQSINNPDGKIIWDFINRLRELDLYVHCMEHFITALETNNAHSKGLVTLLNEIKSLYQSGQFEALKNDIQKLTAEVGQIKGLELGVNLDINLNPTSVVLLNFTEETYTYKEHASMLHNFFSTMSTSRECTILKQAPYSQVDPIMNSLTNQVESVLKNIMKDLKRDLKQYVDLSGYHLVHLLPELLFYVRFATYTLDLQSKGFAMTNPTIVTNEQTKLVNFYNLKLAKNLRADQIVSNELSFSKDKKRYLLTGPNRGGKTTLTQGLGQCLLFGQLGLYIPASNGSIAPFDNIYTHFPVDENETGKFGRLGDEAQRIHDIIQKATNKSIILLNESFSTTSFSEGLYIAKDIIKSFAHFDFAMLYNTHMHELAQFVEQEHYGVSLVMDIEEGTRTYKVIEAPATGTSYASDIAKKYGISYEQLIHQKK